MAKKTIQVVYKVDNAELIKSKQAIVDSEKAAKKADDEIKKFGRDAKKAGQDAGGSFLNLKNVIGGLIALGIGRFFVDLGKKIFDLGVKQEQLTIAFNTFLGSATKAKKLLADLTKFAIVTPFTPDQVNNAAKALLSFGVAGKDVIPTLKMLGDVSSGTGKDLTEMAIIFGQIRSTGRLMGQDLLQLINAGFNPLQEISQNTGKSVKQLKEEMEKGLISFDMVSESFKRATSEGGLFFNLMEKQSQTVGGLLSTVEGNIDEILKNLFAASSGPIKSFVDQLVSMSEAFLELSKSEEQISDEKEQKQIAEATELFKAYAEAFDNVNDAAKSNNKLLDEEEKRLRARNDEIYKGAKAKDGEYADNFKRIDQIEIERQAVNQYIISLEEERNEKLKKDADDAKNARLERELKIRKGIQKILDEPFVEPAVPSDLGIGFAGEGLSSDLLASLEAYGDSILAEQQRQADEQFFQQAENDARELTQLEAKEERKKALLRTGYDFAVDLLGQLLMASINKEDQEFKRQEFDYERKRLLAGDNQVALQQIDLQREEFERQQGERQKAFEFQQARKQKELQIKQMKIQTALNVLRALGQGFPIPNFANAGLTALYGLGQIAIANAIGLKEGMVNIKGPGTTTSDSIPALLSKGESVINADATSRSLNLLEAINEKRIDDRILNGAKNNSGGITVDWNNKELVDAIYKTAKPSVTREGYTMMETYNKGKSLKIKTRAKLGL